MNDQRALADQLDDLERLAVKHGLYDAHDWMRGLRGQVLIASGGGCREGMNTTTPAPLTANARVVITKGCMALGITKGTTAIVVEVTALGREYGHSAKVVLRFVNGIVAGKSFALYARHPNRLADSIIRFNNGNPLNTVEVRRA